MDVNCRRMLWKLSVPWKTLNMEDVRMLSPIHIFGILPGPFISTYLPAHQNVGPIIWSASMKCSGRVCMALASTPLPRRGVNGILFPPP